MRYDEFDRLQCWILPSSTPVSGYNPANLTTAIATAGSVNGDCASGDFEYYGYDANGNRTSFRNRAGEILSYGYDALDRMTSKDRPGSEPDVAYTYDLRGLQLTAAFPSTGEEVAHEYDGFGQVRASKSSRSGFAVRYEYEYDADGNRIVVRHPDNIGFGYVRDGLGRVSAIQVGGANLISIGYDAMGRRKSLSRGDGSTTTYRYDGASRLTRLNDDLGSASDLTIALSYNPASQIVGRDSSNALFVWAGHGNGSSSFPADGLNRTTHVDGTALGYDAKGNMSFDGARSFVYDSENRLSSPAAPYHYDPLGRIAGAHISPGGPLATVYDNSEGDGLIAERAPGTLAPKRRHVFGPGVDEPLIWYEGSGTSAPRYLHADERGSIVAVTDGSGAVQNINTYDEYGRTQNTDPYWQSRFGFTGQRYFAGFELYYYKARFYHPRLGRFMQTDPVGYDDQINLYAYVGNDPVNRTDPDGKQATSMEQATDRNDTDYLSGRISKHEYDERQQARTTGGLIGIGVVSVVITGGRLLSSAASLAGRALGLTRSVTAIERANIAATNFKVLAESQGMTLARVGEIIGWGGGRTGAADAIARTAEINRAAVAGMREAGLTRSLATAARDTYRAAAETGIKGRAAALERLKLMEKILNNW